MKQKKFGNICSIPNSVIRISKHSGASYISTAVQLLRYLHMTPIIITVIVINDTWNQIAHNKNV